MKITRRSFLIGGGAALGWQAAGAPIPRVQLSFGVITDLHYADIDNSGVRFYRDSKAKLAECVARMNVIRPDFLIELGDFKDQAATPEATLADLREIEGVFQEFKGRRYHVLGNHDMDCLTKGQFTSQIVNSGIARGRTYYSFDCKGYHCVVLDANFLLDGTPYERGNFDWREALVPEWELQWLERDLARGRGPTIVFIHQLLDRDAGNLYVRNAAAVRQVLEASGRVKAVFQGHHHSGSYAQVNGIHYCTMRGAIVGTGAENNAYALVEVLCDGTLAVTGYRRELSQRLSV